MKIIKKVSEIKACCASCNGSGYSGGVDGNLKKINKVKFVLLEKLFSSRQKAA